MDGTSTPEPAGPVSLLLITLVTLLIVALLVVALLVLTWRVAGDVPPRHRAAVLRALATVLTAIAAVVVAVLASLSS